MPKELLLEQVNNGLILLLLGMGFVFIFLTLLVFTTKLLSLLVRTLLPQKIETPVTRPLSASGTSVTDSAGTEIAAAITAAVAAKSQR
ncbi:MAG: OadG family transporter subunit [Sphaerochaetaceae bacterium]|jgi:oxaloacetate decarboxylase gamma subunit